MSKIRTFIAVETSRVLQDNASRLIKRLDKTQAKVRWADKANMHITVKFLGDVVTEQITEVCRAVEGSVLDFRQFNLSCAGAGAFPDHSRPRTIWLGCQQGAEELIALHTTIDAAMGKLGFPSEGRRYQPHLTIGRVRGGGPAIGELGDLIVANQDFDAGQASVEEVVVFSSELSRKGPTYVPMSRIKLADQF